MHAFVVFIVTSLMLIIRSCIYVDDVCHFFCWQIHELTMKLSLQKSQYAELKSQFEGQCSLVLHIAINLRHRINPRQ